MGNRSSKSNCRSMASLRANLVISPKAKHLGTVIFLHGLGDTGHGWMSEFQQCALPNVKYIFPTAPMIPVTLNGRMQMPAWFDIFGLDANAQQDEAGIKSASGQLSALVAEEQKLVPSSRVMIGGFSQGGSLALYTALTSDIKLSGVMAFSCWLPLHKTITIKPEQAQVPIYQAHGTADMMVPYQLGLMTASVLKGFNSSHQITTLEGVGHSGSAEELAGATAFIEKHMCKDD